MTIHSWKVSQVPFKIPALLISASHWAKQGVHTYPARRATSYLLVTHRILWSLFYFFPKTRVMTEANQMGGKEISLLTALFPSYLRTSQVFPSMSISLPITQRFFSSRLYICHCSVPQHHQETENVKRQQYSFFHCK